MSKCDILMVPIDTVEDVCETLEWTEPIECAYVLDVNNEWLVLDTKQSFGEFLGTIGPHITIRVKVFDRCP